MGRSNAQATRYDWVLDTKRLYRLIDRNYNTVNGFAKAKGLSYSTVCSWLDGVQPRANLLMQALDGERIPMERMMRRVKNGKAS